MVSRKPSLMPSYWGSSSVCSHHTSSMIASHCWSFSVCLLPDLTGEISFPQKNHLRDSLWIGRQSLCPGVLGVCACMGVFRNKPGTQGQTLKRNENVKSMGFIQQQQRLRTFWGGEQTVVRVCSCRRPKRGRFHPWVGKIPWSRQWQPTPTFLTGKFHGQRSLQSTGHGVAESDMTDWAHIYTQVRISQENRRSS